MKRRRSVTPSGLRGKLANLTDVEMDELNLRSPLAKRKKLADQRGASGLRQEVDISDENVISEQTTIHVTPAAEGGEAGGYASEYDDDASSIASEDDFLAAELEAELG